MTPTHRKGTAQEVVSAEWAARVSHEIRRRVGVVARLDTSERARSMTRRAIADPDVGLELFMRDFMWTYDPRNMSPVPKDIPMIVWPRQMEFLEWLTAIEDSGDDGVCDKSRDTGVTWLVVGYMVWRWLTVPGWAGAIGSRKADLMDRIDDPKSVFWKVEYVISMLPPWLRPKGYDPKKHRNYARIINPLTRASITGEAGPDMGRGGRATFYFLDEFGSMARAATVRAAVADNARSVLYVSTATGPETEFYAIIHSGQLQHFQLSWTADPRKAPEWRDDYLRKYGPVITAKEVDIDYTGGSDDAFIMPAWVKAAVDIDLTALGITPDQPRSAGVDPGGGSAETVYASRVGPLVAPLEAWISPDVVEAAHKCAVFGKRDEVDDLRYDNIGIGASVGGTIERRDGEARIEYTVTGVNVGLPATDTYYDDNDTDSANERFANLKAELWWNLRIRFHHTWRVHVHGDDPDYDLLISIPDDGLLIRQLCAPKQEHTGRGMVRVESKASLARRGVPSPDRADALVLAFADAVGHHSPRIGRL